MNVETRWRLLVFASTAAAIVATIVASADAFSMLPLLWFLAVIPGLPYVRMFRSDDPVQLWVTTIGLSIAIDALVAEVLLYAHTYSVLAAIGILGGVACAGAVIGRLRTRGDPEPADAASVPG